MQHTINNQDTDDLDLTKIAALQQKRTLAFINHFVITTVQFLNTFSKTCENKLKQFEEKLEKVDAAMVLLEARLSSIPEVNEVETNNPKQESNSTEEKSEMYVNETSVISEQINQDLESSETNVSVQAKPEYERFLKMIQVGVPLEAVKLKLSLEGLDPKELDRLLKK